MRRAARKDGNEVSLRDAWEAIGGSWLSIYPIEGGEPDALLGFRGRQCLVEVKDGRKRASARKLRGNQVEWHRTWRGEPVRVVISMADLEALANQLSV
jgi:hypothetical protein